MRKSQFCPLPVIRNIVEKEYTLSENAAHIIKMAIKENAEPLKTAKELVGAIWQYNSFYSQDNTDLNAAADYAITLTDKQVEELYSVITAKLKMPIWFNKPKK